MANMEGALGGAAGGAALGAQIGGGPGAAIGGVLGGVAGLFSKKPKVSSGPTTETTKYHTSKVMINGVPVEVMWTNAPIEKTTTGATKTASQGTMGSLASGAGVGSILGSLVNKFSTPDATTATGVNTSGGPYVLQGADYRTAPMDFTALPK